MTKNRVAVVGDALIDELRDNNDGREFVGGAALNVAVGLAILGVKATLIAMVGNDADGGRIRSYLDFHGVELVPTIGSHGSSRAVSHRVNGDPQYEFNEAAQYRRIEFDDAAVAALDAAGFVVVSCFPFDNTSQLEALEIAVRSPEQRLIVDPNPRSGMLHDATAFRIGFERVAARSLVTKVGSDDAALLYGIGLDALLARLIGGGAYAVVGTAGQDGGSVRTSDGVSLSEPIVYLPGPVIDTMGAGDATLASVVNSVATHGIPHNGVTWRAVLVRAMTVAAATCRHEGALLRIPTIPPA